MSGALLVMYPTVTSDGREITGPRFSCDTPKCLGAPKLWITVDGEWKCHNCLLKKGALIATPSEPKGER